MYGLRALSGLVEKCECKTYGPNTMAVHAASQPLGPQTPILSVMYASLLGGGSK